MALPRCSWVSAADALYCAYHDAEWGVPERDSRMLWEMLMLEGFQAGLSWITILRKREGFRAAFAGFDPDRVAAFGPDDIERLMGDPGIVRARAKIEATIRGAQIFCDMRDRGEDFAAYVWAFVDGTPIQNDGVHFPAKTDLSEVISQDLKKRGFKFVGPTIVYAWMQAIGMVNDHAVDCFRREPLRP
ncbi:DNA-3-methyladenine glycosylase I [Sphingobium sp. AP50]|uniref:DNA-3-methyladenine glycosylase I n=1 Tax=Sphingobium sp. AP50 TaxID=1884369 RepID=UPI000B890552|nr:DNA-3-methyladenine glycosylase I [Sphingobium sp. AP50]